MFANDSAGPGQYRPDEATGTNTRPLVLRPGGEGVHGGAACANLRVEVAIELHRWCNKACPPSRGLRGPGCSRTAPPAHP